MKREGEHSGEPLHDLRNMEVIDRILFSGTPAEQKALQEFHGVSEEDFKRLVYFTSLRHETHDRVDHDVEKRTKEQPTASPEEQDLGSYVEGLEPQVREAVMTLRRKGYPTYESGFYAASEVQTIGLSEPLLEGFTLPEELLNDPRVLSWDNTPTHITFQPNTGVTMDELKDLWDTIAQTLPDRGIPAAPSTLPQSEWFRERQQNQ